jgi:hypothetical protein
MKRALTILASVLTAASAASAQYAVNWHKIAGGCGTISDGQYTINATLGQHDAGGPLTGGGYSLTGGFWYIATQMPGAPTLRLFLTSTNTVVLAWPASPAGFHLEQKTALNAVGWSFVTNVVNAVSGENRVIISPLMDYRFYRLVYP